MRSTILIGFTFFVLATGAWAANLVSIHPAVDNAIDPLAPLTMTVAWK